MTIEERLTELEEKVNYAPSPFETAFPILAPYDAGDNTIVRASTAYVSASFDKPTQTLNIEVPNTGRIESINWNFKGDDVITQFQENGLNMGVINVNVKGGVGSNTSYNQNDDNVYYPDAKVVRRAINGQIIAIGPNAPVNVIGSTEYPVITETGTVSVILNAIPSENANAGFTAILRF